MRRNKEIAVISLLIFLISGCYIYFFANTTDNNLWEDENLVYIESQLGYDYRFHKKIKSKYKGVVVDHSFLSGNSMRLGHRVMMIRSKEIIDAQVNYLFIYDGLFLPNQDILNKAKNKLIDLSFKEDWIDQIEKTGTVFEYMPIYSPATSNDVIIHKQIGDSVDKKDILLTYGQYAYKSISFELPLRYYDIVGLGERFDIQIDNDSEKIKEGQIFEIEFNLLTISISAIVKDLDHGPLKTRKATAVINPRDYPKT